jgi:hypothetical protein
VTEEQARAKAFDDFWRAAQTGRSIKPGDMPPEGTGFGDYWRTNYADIGPPVGPARYATGAIGEDVPVYWAFVRGVYKYRPGEGVSPA